VTVPKPIKFVVPVLNVMMDDGATFDVQPTNYEMVMYDRTARKRGWPRPEENQIEWMTFLAWQYLTRTGLLALEYETFVLQCASIVPVGTDEIPPTLPAPGAG
jgi:hypothetical protein